MDITRRVSAYQTCAAKWRALCLVLLAFARLMRRHEDGAVHGAFEQSQRLQILCRAAHVMLVQELSDLQAEHSVQSDQDAFALAQLQLIATSMLALMFVTLCILKRGVLSAYRWMHARTLYEPVMHARTLYEPVMPAARTHAVYHIVPIRDSS